MWPGDFNDSEILESFRGPDTLIPAQLSGFIRKTTREEKGGDYGLVGNTFFVYPGLCVRNPFPHKDNGMFTG